MSKGVDTGQNGERADDDAPEPALLFAAHGEGHDDGHKALDQHPDSNKGQDQAVDDERLARTHQADNTHNDRQNADDQVQYAGFLFEIADEAEDTVNQKQDRDVIAG